MADDPVFPKPRAKGSAYREPEPRAAEPTTAPKKTLVTRAEPPTEAPRGTGTARMGEAHTLLASATSERAFWAKETFTARYPRATGAVLLVVSSFLLFPAVMSRLEGRGFADERAAVIGGISFMAGLWLLAAKMPLQANGRPPAWWATGMTACTIVGAVVGAAI